MLPVSKKKSTNTTQGQGALSQAAAHSPACAATTRRLPKVFQTGRRWKSSPITCGVIFQKKILSITSNKPFKWGTQTQRHPSQAYAALPVDWTNVAHLPVAGLSLEVEYDKWRVKSTNSSVLQTDAWGCGKNATTGRWEAYLTVVSRLFALYQFYQSSIAKSLGESIKNPAVWWHVGPQLCCPQPLKPLDCLSQSVRLPSGSQSW